MVAQHQGQQDQDHPGRAQEGIPEQWQEVALKGGLDQSATEAQMELLRRQCPATLLRGQQGRDMVPGRLHVAGAPGCAVGPQRRPPARHAGTGHQQCERKQAGPEPAGYATGAP